MAECSALIGIQMVTGKFAACHSTDGMNKVMVVKVFKPVLVWVMGVRVTIEVMSQRVFDSVFVTSILWNNQNIWNNGHTTLTWYSSSLYIKGVMAQLVLVRLPA